MGIQEQGSRRICAGTEERGVNPRRRNGTVRCMFFPIGAGAPVTRGSGEGFAERTGESPRTESGYSVPSLFGGFPAGAYAVHKNVCTKV